MFRSGDWVIDGNWRLGIIQKVGTHYCSIVFVKNSEGQPMKQHSNTPIYELRPAPLHVQGEDYKVLMDMALTMGDKEWAKEIYIKMFNNLEG